MDKEMELLLSEKEIKIGDKTVVVKRIALLDTIRLATRLSDIVGLMVRSSEAFSEAFYKISYNGRKTEDGNEVKESQNDINGVRALGLIEILGLVGEDGTDILKDLIVKSTNLDEREAESIDCIDGIDLLFTIFEVNKGFFEKCMNKLKEKIAKKNQKESEKEKSK